MNKEERAWLRKTVKKLEKDPLIVEVGSWTGGSSEVIAKSMRGGMLHCVDLWCYDEDAAHPKLVELARGRNIFGEFAKRMAKYHPITIKSYSVAAADGFEDISLDMVFLDGDHSYGGVKEDIEAWWPKIKYGGVMCGHDYGRPEYGVTKAVDEYFGGPVNNPARSMWEVFKDS